MKKLQLISMISMGVIATSALAQPMFTEYTGPTSPVFEAGYSMVDICSGPEGNLWFTENYAFGAQTQIGRITPNGTTTYYSVPSGSSEGGIATGPDGNLWFTQYRTGRIGKLTPGGVFTEFPIPGGGYPTDITAGPDGNLWFGDSGAGGAGCIGRVTPAGVITKFATPNNAGAPQIVAGPDGNLWFTMHLANKIGRISTSGAITEFSVPTPNGYPWGIAAGPDGNLWFAENLGNKIGRITPAGVITEFTVPNAGSQPVHIAAGPDGNVWFTEDNGNNIGRITMSGVITEFPTPLPSRGGGICTGPDGNLWFLESTANKIVKTDVMNVAHLASFAIAPSGIVCGNIAIGMVTLDAPAPAGGTTIALSDNSAVLNTPASVIVPQGSTTASFPIGTFTTSVQITRQVQARLGSQLMTRNLIVLLPDIMTMTASPKTVKGGNPLQAFINANGTAGHGFVVDLSSSGPELVPPASVTFQYSKRAVSFQVETLPVASTVVRVMTASRNGRTRTVTITITR